MIFVIGWHGEPDVHDEPQHVYQGLMNLKLPEGMDIAACIVSAKTTEVELKQAWLPFGLCRRRERPFALIYKEKALYTSVY